MKKYKRKDTFIVSVFAVIFFIIYILQYTDGIFANVNNFPQLMLTATVCSGLFLGETLGAVFGFIIGAGVDAVSVDAYCYNTICLMLIGYFCGVVVKYIINNNFKSIFFVMLVAEIIYFAGIFIISGFNKHILFNHTIIVAIYTYIFSIPFYAMVYFIVYARKKYLIKHN